MKHRQMEEIGTLVHAFMHKQETKCCCAIEMAELYRQMMLQGLHKLAEFPDICEGIPEDVMPEFLRYKAIAEHLDTVMEAH